MPDCERINQVHAYHDGELPAPLAAALEEHLRQCPACAAELAWLGKSRQVLQAGQRPELPGELVSRIQRRIAREPDRAALRLTWGLTAAAAVIVLICLPQVRLISPQTVTAGDIPPWELAVIPAGFEDPAAISEEHQVARWIVEDLSAPPAETVDDSGTGHGHD